MADLDSAERVRTAVEANTAGLLSYFYRRVSVPEDAADLLSDTFLVIWRRSDALPEDSTEVRMWLYGIARNVLSTHHRSQRRRTNLEDKLRLSLRNADRPDASMNTDPHHVVSCVQRLDPTDREIIRLTYWDGFTLAQAATLMGLTESTVRSRHHRAKGRLGEMLQAVHDLP